jgi:hypothetical protein
MLAIFQPLIDAARGVPLDDPKAAAAELRRRLDPKSERALVMHEELKALLAEGKIANRGEMPVKFGRAAKAGAATANFSIDVVHMQGDGPQHVHPRGEIDYCIPLEGEPTFEGQSAGWVVMPPGSVHVPSVKGGTMLIVYLLPLGEIEFTG